MTLVALHRALMLARSRGVGDSSLDYFSRQETVNPAPPNVGEQPHRVDKSRCTLGTYDGGTYKEGGASSANDRC